MKKKEKGFACYPEKSFLDEEKMCVHMPVEMGDGEYIDNDTIHWFARRIDAMHPKLRFSGLWELSPENGKAKEVLFFYE